MLVSQLDLPDAPNFYAVDTIIKPHLEQLSTIGGNAIFDKGGVRYGLAYPAKVPTIDVPLTCYIWMDSYDPEMDSTPMFIRETKTMVSLYINFLDKSGGKDNINKRRSALARWILLSLEGDDHATNNPPGLPQYVGMEFEYGSFKVDHTTPFKRINDFLPSPEPPWYTSRIDFVIKCDNNVLPTVFTPY